MKDMSVEGRIKSVAKMFLHDEIDGATVIAMRMLLDEWSNLQPDIAIDDETGEEIEIKLLPCDDNYTNI